MIKYHNVAANMGGEEDKMKNVCWGSGIVLTLLSCTSICTGELNEMQISTQIPQDARYELVQSQIAAKGTFRVDRYNGNVYQLVQDKDGNLTWELMQKLNHPKDSPKESRINYQIFMSGIAYKYTFLMNIWTGATWQLKQDSTTEALFWDPLIRKSSGDVPSASPSSENGVVQTSDNNGDYSAVNDTNSIFYKKNK
jgi:hypothetical protein